MKSEHRKLLTEMALTTSMSFLRWGAQAVFSWSGVPTVPCPVLHIHGSRDRVIGCKGEKPGILVRGGGHVVNLTHAAEVNAAILRFTSQLAPPRTSPACP